MSAPVLSLSDFCQASGLPASLVPEVVRVLQERELLELARHEARMRACAGRPDGVARPLQDGQGEFGVVEARIPKTLFYNLLARKNFGWDGLTSDEGLRDILRDNPQCRVKTQSGKIVSGWRGPPRKTLKRYATKSS